MTVAHQLTNRIGDEKNAELWKHVRDTQLIFNNIPVTEHRTMETFYAEPMTMGGLQEEPFCIELVRIVNLLQGEQPVTGCTGFLNFVWKPQKGGAVINNVNGMSVGTNGTTKYRFYYRITYRMV